MVSVIPKDKEHWLSLRKNNINSTEVAALFNCSPYKTTFELWHQKRGSLEDTFTGNERTKWGTRLQDAIALGIAEDQAWSIRKMDEYIYDEELRAGSSFDYSIQENTALLEIKNVDSLAFREGWIVEANNVEAPLFIELQVQHQMMLSRRQRAYIGALVGGNQTVLIEREYNHNIINEIKDRIKKFWASVDMGHEPRPDFERDYETIKSLYRAAKKGKLVEGTAAARELVESYSNISEQISNLNKKKDAIKGQLLMLIGDAEKMIGDGFSVSAGIIEKPSYTVQASAYRNFRVRFKGEE